MTDLVNAHFNARVLKVQLSGEGSYAKRSSFLIFWWLFLHEVQAHATNFWQFFPLRKT